MNTVRERDYNHVKSLISDLKMRIRNLDDQNKEAERDYSVRQEKEQRAIKHYENDI